MTELNILPLLSPAFNRNLLQLESANINNEKYSYILDILTNEMQVQSLYDAINGFPEYSGNVALYTVNQADGYIKGDTVVFFDVISGTYTGIYTVLAVPNADVVILDTPFLAISYFQQMNWLYKIYRNRLPASPDGTATFNANGFSTGIVGAKFNLTDFGLFNVFENYSRFKYLANEEFYQPLDFTNLVDYNGLIRVQSPSRTLEIGNIVQLIQDTGTTYNGIWEVLDIQTGDPILSVAYVGDYIGTGICNLFPKDVLNTLTYGDISDLKFAFNGALKKHERIDFDYVRYDATVTQPCRFLTTIPDNTKMRISDKGYIQFFQSDKMSCMQYVIDVTDQGGIIQQYIVNLNGVNDELLGLSVGAGDLNSIPLTSFDTVPGRALPVIQECDKSYEVYLQGTEGCQIGGTQTVDFSHPLGANVLNANFWGSQQWGNVQIQIPAFDIGGVPQAVFPSLTIYTPTNFTSQPYELIYATELDIATGGILNVVVPQTGLGFQNGFEFDIDFNQDFYLKMRIVIQAGGGPFKPPEKIVDAEYIWDTATCNWSYLINGVENFDAFGNLNGATGLGSIIELSEHKYFLMDWSCCTYSGARLIFEDRLGSFAGFNFTLKMFDDMIVETDGFEQDNFSITDTVIDRGFHTIQSSYSHQLTIATDFIREEDMTYLQEAFSSPNVYVQYDGGIAPCIVLPGKHRIEKKENTSLIRVTMVVSINGTNFSQRN